MSKVPEIWESVIYAFQSEHMIRLIVGLVLISGVRFVFFPSGGEPFNARRLAALAVEKLQMALAASFVDTLSQRVMNKFEELDDDDSNDNNSTDDDSNDNDSNNDDSDEELDDVDSGDGSNKENNQINKSQ
jgi:hypothetical protein